MRGLKKKKIINLSLATMLTFPMLISNVSAYVNTNDEKASEKVNLALNKAAFASSEETNTFTAKKVTDGIVDRVFHPSVSQSGSLLPLRSPNGFRPF